MGYHLDTTPCFSPSLCLCLSSVFLFLSCAKTQPGTLRVCLLILFVLLLSFSLFVIALSFPLSGDRFWLCQTCKGPDLDTVWHPRISGPRDYSQQGEPPLFSVLSCELSTVFPFKIRFAMHLNKQYDQLVAQS